MIGRLTGRVLDCSPGRVLIDVTGVGYDVQIPLSTFYDISSETGTTVSLHVHTHVREDALVLFGFGSEDERAIFEKLISISGVGPKMALAVLSGIGVAELAQAIVRGDRGRLQRIPGVGKKTAERMLLELRDKMNLADAVAVSSDDAPGTAPRGPLTSLGDDAVSALTNLGYRNTVAERAVLAAVRDEGPAASIEAVLKRALSSLVR